MSDLTTFITELQNSLHHKKLDDAVQTLSRAKRALLQQNVLFPSATTPPHIRSQAREILELGAITSLRQMDSASFIRYYQQLQPFYDIERDPSPAAAAAGANSKTSQRSKITGLYLLLLLSSGDTSQFHTVLEGLIVEASLEGRSVEDDPFIRYPVELERSLMEGSYDKVWRATKSSEVPTEDFGLFSNVISFFIPASLSLSLSPPLSSSFLLQTTTDLLMDFLNRSSSEPSEEKSQTAPRLHTNPFQSPTQRIYSSSNLKVPWFNSQRSVAGP